MTGSNFKGMKKVLWSVLGIWFLAMLLAGYMGVFGAGFRYSMSVPIPLGLAAMLPIVGFGIWYKASERFRESVLSINPVVLTAVHTLRVEGIVFLILMAKGMLPRAFAYPAGLGDITIGVTAPLVALALSRRKLPAGVLVLWNMAGIADLVIAMVTAVLSSLGILAHGATMGVMGLLPMSLIPTFGVPLLLILHVICLAQVRRSRLEGDAIFPLSPKEGLSGAPAHF